MSFERKPTSAEKTASVGRSPTMVEPSMRISTPDTIKWWQFTATAALSFAFGVSTVWFSGGKDYVGRTELHQVVASESPWIQDRGRVQLQLEHDNEAIRALTQQVTMLVTSQARVTVQVEELLVAIKHREAGAPKIP